VLLRYNDKLLQHTVALFQHIVALLQHITELVPIQILKNHIVTQRNISMGIELNASEMMLNAKGEMMPLAEEECAACTR